MKTRHFLLFVALILIQLNVSAQKQQQTSKSTGVPTTQEEYNYLTKGYKMQIEGGLDMKKGYSFKDLGSYQNGSTSTPRTCEFKALYRTGESKPCAILCIISVTGGKRLYYLCIPSETSKSEIWNEYSSSVGRLDSFASSLLQGALAKLASTFITIKE